MADADQIADIQILGWQWAYRGLIAQSYLDAMPQSRERREENWRCQLAISSDIRIWVSERDDRVVGFAATGASGDEDSGPGTGELRALYIRPEVANKGIGRALLSRAVEDLSDRYQRARLWVLQGNERAIRFYKIAGWRADGSFKKDERGAVSLTELRYAIELSR